MILDFGVDFLQGQPGIYSSRYAGPSSTDNQNNQKLLKALYSASINQRSAHFCCRMVMAHRGEVLANFTGKLEGNIAEVCRGKQGFGYDPLFIPEGYQKTLAELGFALKQKISHRTLALKQVRSWLE